MSVRIERGDVLETDAPYICQQVNCQGTMGAGLAKQIADKWPQVKREYIRFCEKYQDRHDLLGLYQMVAVNGGNQKKGDPVVVNIFGQEYYGHDGVYTDNTALMKAFRHLNRNCAHETLAFPYGFGCGLAGGDWQDVEQLIVKCFPDCDVVIYMK